MTIAIHQPDYIPYPGYFYKILKSDIFVFLDDAQFSNNGGHDFNLIKTQKGALKLKVPVQQSLGDEINKVKTKDFLGWKQKHLHAIALNYQKAPFFDKIFAVYKELMEKGYDNIAEMNEAIIKRFCKEFGLNKIFLRSSEMGIKSKGEERIIDICKYLNADIYFSGNGARAYQEEKHFSDENIQLVYSDYKPVQYNQLWGDFIENLSILDYVMNCDFVLT